MKLSATLLSPIATVEIARPAEVTQEIVEIKPLAPERYKVQFTVSGETYATLRQVQDPIRHLIPDGDVALIPSG